MAIINGKDEFAVHIVTAAGGAGGEDLENIDAALDRIIEKQFALIGHQVKLLNSANGIGGEAGCYVSTTRPINAEDYDVHLTALNTTDRPQWFEDEVLGAKKLYVWTDNPAYYVSAYKQIVDDYEHIGDFEAATSYDKACVIEVHGVGTYAFFGTR